MEECQKFRALIRALIVRSKDKENLVRLLSGVEIHYEHYG